MINFLTFFYIYDSIDSFLLYNRIKSTLGRSFMKNQMFYTGIPTQSVGPLYFAEMRYLNKTELSIELDAPLTTYETTLFHSVGRGAKISRLAKTLKGFK